MGYEDTALKWLYLALHEDILGPWAVTQLDSGTMAALQFMGQGSSYRVCRVRSFLSSSDDQQDVSSPLSTKGTSMGQYTDFGFFFFKEIF